MSNGLIFKICIGDLAAYNNGFLVYEWIDLLESSWEEVIAKKNSVLEQGYDIVINQVWEGDYDAVPKHEEWHIQDFSNNIGIRVNEYSSLETVYKFAQVIRNYNPNLLKAINTIEDTEMKDYLDDTINIEDFHLIEDIHSNKDLGREVFVELYGSEPVNLKSITESMSNLLARHFDFESYGRELIHSGNYRSTDLGFLYNPN